MRETDPIASLREMVDCFFLFSCPGGGIGRREGLKPPCSSERTGSIPVSGTIFRVEYTDYIEPTTIGELMTLEEIFEIRRKRTEVLHQLMLGERRRREESGNTYYPTEEDLGDQ